MQFNVGEFLFLNCFVQLVEYYWKSDYQIFSKFYLFVYIVYCLQVSVVNGLVIIMLVVGVHHVVTGLTVHRTGEVAAV